MGRLESFAWQKRLPRALGEGVLASIAALLLGVVFAAPARAADDFLEPQQAFRFSARVQDAKSVEVAFDIAPGYYLYREQFRFAAQGAELGAPVIPAGKTKFDETFQKNVETYRDHVAIVVPVAQAGAEFRLVVTSQGCADRGLCYPPMESRAAVRLAGFGGDGSLAVVAADPAPTSTGTTSTVDTGVARGAAATTSIPAAASSDAMAIGDSASIDAVLKGGAFWPIVGVFFVAGLLLSLTPCVLPMLPIVSSIIVGQIGSTTAGSAAVSRRRGLALAASYSLGMALVYTAFGIAAGLAGEGLAAALQNPWVLAGFALALVVLSLSMFGVYELQLPSALAGRVTAAAQKMPAGRVLGVCAMGGVSALIVSPCVAAPLAGALLYLSQTRDVWLGGTALFSLAAGMSVPLLLVGASAGALLPRAGAWMVEVKAAFGVLLLGVALWTVQPLLPGPLALVGWGLLALGAAAALYARARAARSLATTAPSASRLGWRALAAIVLALVGVSQLAGAAAGGTDPLQPLASFASRGGASVAEAAPRFATIRTSADLDAALRTAGRPVVLDFYADWCVSCKEMDRYTFADPSVRKKLGGALLLRADVTANNADDRELLKRFHLYGPPGTIFFSANGAEVLPARVVGYQDSSRFNRTLAVAGL